MLEEILDAGIVVKRKHWSTFWRNVLGIEVFGINMELEKGQLGEVLFGGSSLIWARPVRKYLEDMWSRRKEGEERADSSIT